MAERKPQLSIGMPAYNSEAYLHSALDSILGQSFGDFELIIADNGSTDATEEIVQSYASSDSRISYSRNEKNLGATANYNAVARRARAKYFKWASSNDICKPDFFEKCVQLLDENPEVVLCYPQTRLFDDETGYEEDYVDISSVTDDDPCERFVKTIDGLRLNNVMNGVARTEAMQKTRLIPDIYCGDQCVIAELAMMGKLVEVPGYLFYRRMDKASATHMKSAEDVHLHFDPEGATPMLFQKWKRLNVFRRAVKDSALRPEQKRRLYKILAVRARWGRAGLAQEFVDAARWHWRSKNNKN